MQLQRLITLHICRPAEPSMLCAGQSSTMTGTYAGQFVMGGFLELHIPQWQRVAITRSVAIAPTFLVALLYAGRASNALDVLTEWLNVLQSVQLPFALIPVSLTCPRPVLDWTLSGIAAPCEVCQQRARRAHRVVQCAAEHAAALWLCHGQPFPCAWLQVIIFPATLRTVRRASNALCVLTMCLEAL